MQGRGIVEVDHRDSVVERGAVEELPGRDEQVEEAVVLEAGLRVAVANRLVQAGGALERRLAVEGRVHPRGHLGGGREGVGVGAPGAELEPQAEVGPGGDLVGRGQPAVGRRRLRQLDVDRGRLVEDALPARGVQGRGDPACVAGEVVRVAQRDLEARHRQAEPVGQSERAGDLSRATRDHDGEGGIGAAHQRQVGVAEHEAADEPGVPLGPAGGVRRGGVGQRGVAGREDGGVVDQAGPGRHQVLWISGLHSDTLTRTRIAD